MKKIISFGIALCLLFGMSVSSFAATYIFTFEQPFLGSMNSTYLQKVVTLNSAYVNPSQTTAPTDYFLSPERISSITATDIIREVYTSGSRNFTYKSGYGNIDDQYCLSGYPTYPDYAKYSIIGTWSP